MGDSSDADYGETGSGGSFGYGPEDEGNDWSYGYGPGTEENWADVDWGVDDTSEDSGEYWNQQGSKWGKGVGSGVGTLLGPGGTILGGLLGTIIGGAWGGPGYGTMEAAKAGSVGGNELPEESLRALAVMGYPGGNVNPAEWLKENQANLIENLYLKQQFDFLTGNFDVTGVPTYQSGKVAANRAYELAKRGTLETLPRGGSLNAALGGVELDRARTLSALSSDIGQDIYNKISGYATPGAGGASAFTRSLDAQLQASQAYQQAQEAASKNQMMGAIGQGIGSYMGGK